MRTRFVQSPYFYVEIDSGKNLFTVSISCSRRIFCEILVSKTGSLKNFISRIYEMQVYDICILRYSILRIFEGTLSGLVVSLDSRFSKFY